MLPNSFRPGVQKHAARFPFPVIFEKIFRTYVTYHFVQAFKVGMSGYYPVIFRKKVVLEIFEVICAPNFVCRLEI